MQGIEFCRPLSTHELKQHASTLITAIVRHVAQSTCNQHRCLHFWKLGTSMRGMVNHTTGQHLHLHVHVDLVNRKPSFTGSMCAAAYKQI
eukprot:1158903-Pelagomonas_calceolata.AAC.6